MPPPAGPSPGDPPGRGGEGERGGEEGGARAARRGGGRGRGVGNSVGGETPVEEHGEREEHCCAEQVGDHALPPRRSRPTDIMAGTVIPAPTKGSRNGFSSKKPEKGSVVSEPLPATSTRATPEL